MPLIEFQSETEVDNMIKFSGSKVCMDNFFSKSTTFIKRSFSYITIIVIHQPVILDFFADWCCPRRRVSAIIDGWIKQYSEVVFFKIDVDKFCVSIIVALFR